MKEANAAKTYNEIENVAQNFCLEQWSPIWVTQNLFQVLERQGYRYPVHRYTFLDF